MKILVLNCGSSSLKYQLINMENENRTLKGVETEISTKDSKIKVFIIPTNEELMIARQTLKAICNK